MQPINQNNELRIYCNKCAGETRHEILRDYIQDIEGRTIYWQIVKCAGCDTVSFYEEHKLQKEEDVWETTEWVVYPQRLYRTAKLFPNIPAVLDQLYREALDAFNSASFLLCGGGLRALVEGICADQGVINGPKKDAHGAVIGRGTNLECKIDGLAEKGILTEKQAQILHQHRYLGNAALHELEVPAKDALIYAFNLLEHIMEEIYSIENQALQLQQIRQSKQKP